MPGTLYVVATPIGNLEDVTLRSLRILREVSLIAAEDTRRTSRLLQQYSISTPTTSLHEHNEPVKLHALVHRLRDGESVALVSDAGTPTISDPGAHLVAAAHAAGIRVEPIPGASAAIAAVSASGFNVTEVRFVGFPPYRSKARKDWLAGLAHEQGLLVFYEAPHRIKATLGDMLEIFGDRDALLCRELTKVHEYVVKRPISRLLSSEIPERGEFTLVVSPAARESTPHPDLPSDPQLTVELGHMIAEGSGSRRELIRKLAAKYGVSARTIYQAIERGRHLVVRQNAGVGPLS